MNSRHDKDYGQAEVETPMDQRVRAAVAYYLRRRANDQAYTESVFLREHEDLLPELRIELSKLQRIDAARRAAQDPDEDLGISNAWTYISGPRIRCPNCSSVLQFDDKSSLDELVCASCGDRVSLLESADKQRSIEGTTIGHFRLIQQVGCGGFGTVWRAHDEKLDRQVAIKVPRLGLHESQAVEHFFREARAAAQLRHPHIVAVHEVGRDGDNVYIVSDFVDGIPLSHWIIDCPPTIREAAQISATLAESVDHAHRAGVIHRDLKPSNVLVDSNGQPHITDFGLARRNSGEITCTHDGQMLGTPAYMSPEQAAGMSHEADHRSDVYSLGVMLFELLTGELPFRGNVRAVLKAIVESDAPSPRRLRHDIPRDLATICMKCLEKDPGRRYATSMDLAADLRRFLDGLPIHARPIGRVERTWRVCARNRTVASLAATAALLLCVAVGIAAISWRGAVRREQETRAASYSSDMAAASRALGMGDYALAQEILLRHVAEAEDSDLRNWEWRYLANLAFDRRIDHRMAHDSPAEHVAFSADGDRLYVGTDQGVSVWDTASGEKLGDDWRVIANGGLCLSADGHYLAVTGYMGNIHILDVETGLKNRPPIESLHNYASAGTNMVFSNHGNVLFFLDLESEGSLIAYDLDADTRRVIASHLQPMEPGKDWFDLLIQSMAISYDDSMLATVHGDYSVRLWDVDTGKPIGEPLRGHEYVPSAVAFSPDGRLLASGGGDNKVILWDVAGRKKLDELTNHSNFIWTLAFAPDGKTLATSGLDNTVRLWDVTRWSDPVLQKAVLRGHSGSVLRLNYDRQGNQLASVDVHGEAILWDLHQPAPVDEIAHSFMDRKPGAVIGVNPHGEQTSVVGLDHLGRIYRYDFTTGVESTFDLPAMAYACFSPDGTLVACRQQVMDQENLTAPTDIRNAETGDLVARIPWSAPVPVNPSFAPDSIKTAFSWDNRSFVISYDDGVIFHWDLTGEEPKSTRILIDWSGLSSDPVAMMERNAQRPLTASPIFSRFDSTLAFISGSDICAIDLNSGRQQFVRGEHRIRAVAFAPQTRTLAFSGSSGVIQVWDLESDRMETLVANAQVVDALAFTLDGSRVVSGGWDHVIKFWNRHTGELASTLRGHGTKVVQNLRFTYDGRTLVARDFQGKVQLWHAPKLDEIPFTPADRVSAKGALEIGNKAVRSASPRAPAGQ